MRVPPPQKPSPFGKMAVRQARRMRGRSPPKAFPSGGRCPRRGRMRGAMIERFFVGPDALIGPLDGSFRRGISPPAGGEFLCPWRQRNQNATGDGSDERFALIFAFPRPPFTGVIPWGRQNPSGAQNQECLSAVPSGPTGGLSGKKIVAGAFPLLRLPSPNQRPGAVFRRRGGTLGRPEHEP